MCVCVRVEFGLNCTTGRPEWGLSSPTLRKERVGWGTRIDDRQKNEQPQIPHCVQDDSAFFEAQLGLAALAEAVGFPEAVAGSER